MKLSLTLFAALTCCSAFYGVAAEPVRPFPLVVPRGLDLYVPTPNDNRLNTEKIELGRRLFFDPALSLDRSIACSSCHDPERAFTIADAFAKGVNGQRTTRNPPALLNRAYGESFFWDGRVSSLEQQVLQPIQNPREMYLSLEELGRRLKQDAEYRSDFQLAFGRDPNSADVARALASYVRSLLAGDSPYDRYASGDRDALSAEARRGLTLFRGRANCWACHAGPNFTDEGFHNTGVAWRDGGLLDEGRYVITQRPADLGAFKTPTLRNVELTAPYMHDGSLATLRDVVEYYSRGGNDSPNLDREIRPLELKVEEKRHLLAFLQSLTGSIRFDSAGLPAR